MKPYLLVAYNYVRFWLMKAVRCKNLNAEPIQMLSLNTKVKLHRNSAVSLGPRIVSDGRMVIMADENCNLTIGKSVYFNENAMISCKKMVSIGNGCKFGPNVKIFDNDHYFDEENGVSSRHISAPVYIGKRCWIGTNVVILRGTQIGDNCVIGAGCVVKGNIPAGSIVTQSRKLIIRPIKERISYEE